MNTIRTSIAAIAAVTLVGLADCKSNTSPPTPGTVTVSFHSPNTDDGAALFTLTGPGIQDAQAASSTYKVYWRVVSATEVRFLVVGDLTNGVVATMTIDDLNKVKEYAGTFIEVASRTDAVRASVSGYSLSISR
jgi:hypothetical protein